jgi:anti-anti-sigma factor
MDKSRDFYIFFHTIIQGGGRKIIVDMKDLEYIDSSGIGILINTAKLLRSKGGDIALLNVDDEINKILKVINFERFIKMFNEYHEAVNFFRYVL